MTAEFEPTDAEFARLRALLSYRILDTPAEPCFDRIVAMAADICEAPVSLITLIDETRQWSKAMVGTDVQEVPRGIALCSYAIQTPRELTIVPDATLDDRFRENPLVAGGPKIRFYAGAPLLVQPGGEALGTLCVIDLVPRVITVRQAASLRALSRVVVRFLERRRAAQAA